MSRTHNTHLWIAHELWRRHLAHSGGHVVDATCGNGHDALALARYALQEATHRLYALDIQVKALETTRLRLLEGLPPSLQEQIVYLHSSHAQFPACVPRGKVALVVYNLGYLPGGDKAITTLTNSTLQSLDASVELLDENGALSITCYPGHQAGQSEKNAVMNWGRTQAQRGPWNVSAWERLEQPSAPVLLWVQKKAGGTDAAPTPS